MHVLYVAKLAPHLGARRIYETGKRMVVRGHRVSVLSAATHVNQPITENVDGIEITTVKTAPDWIRGRSTVGFYASRMPFYRMAPNVIQRDFSDVDVVVEDVAPLWSAQLPTTTKALGIPLVYQIHNVYETAGGWLEAYGLKGFWGAFKERQLRSHPSCNAIYSDALWTTESLRNVAVPVDWIPNGVDADFFRPGDRRDGSSQDPLRILNVGRLVKLKNHRILLEAAARSEIDFRMRILGTGPLTDALDRNVRDLGISEYVTIEPDAPRDVLLSAYQQADVFCLPSLFEGMPLAAVEAMACGTPVAMSDIAAARGVVTNDIGWLLPPTDVESWTNVLREVSENRHKARQLGIKAMEFAVKTFDWETTVTQEIALFNRVIGL